MRVAVYSGSFDPLHIGHLAIMERICGDGRFDAVYLVVSPQNPLKDPSKAANARERLDAAVQAVARHPELPVRVDGIEFEMEPPHYTIRTLDALSAREPRNRFTLVMGADNLAVIKDWKDWRRILTEYGVAVYPRTGYDLKALKKSLASEAEPGHPFKIRLLKAPTVDISSTFIREARSKGKDVSEWMM